MATTWDNLEKPTDFEGGYDFNEVGISFNQILDPETLNTVFFNGLGLVSVWSNQSPKATTVFTNGTKTASSWSNQLKA